MFLFGIGLLGVGIFPENLPTLHSSFASVSFLGGAVRRSRRIGSSARRSGTLPCCLGRSRSSRS
jgi:hypothetical membrane protein